MVWQDIHAWMDRLRNANETETLPAWEDYQIMLDHFAKYMLGARTFNQVKYTKKFDVMITTSDEALVYILLDNNLEKWEKEKEKEKKDNKRKGLGEQGITVPKTKYTDGTTGAGATLYGGWRETGLVNYRKFNENIAKKIRTTGAYKKYVDDFWEQATKAERERKERKKQKNKGEEQSLFDEERDMNPAGDDLEMIEGVDMDEAIDKYGRDAETEMVGV